MAYSWTVSSLNGPISAQVSRGSGFNSQPSSCDICVEQTDTGVGFPFEYFCLSPVSVIPPMLRTPAWDPITRLYDDYLMYSHPHM